MAWETVSEAIRGRPPPVSLVAIPVSLRSGVRCGTKIVPGRDAPFHLMIRWLLAPSKTFDHTPKPAGPKRGHGNPLIVGRLAMGYGVAYHQRHVDFAKSLGRAAGLAAVLVVAGTSVVLIWDWLKVIAPPRPYSHYLGIWLQEAFLACYFLFLPITALATLVSTVVVCRSRSKSRPGRWLLLFGSALLGLFLSEVGAAIWLSHKHRVPSLPGHFDRRARASDRLLITVVGGSSALGVPYDGWLSIGAIVRRELQEVMPAHQVRVEILAEKGATLEAMHKKLAMMTERPDALVVFSGHNEFLSRFSLANRVMYYADERQARRGQVWLEGVSRYSPLYTLVRENLEMDRVSVVPALLLSTMDTIVGRPICTPEETSAIIADFHRRLEGIVNDCERIGCVPILIIPPGNDASPPNQSYVRPSTDIVTRRILAGRLLDIEATEAEDPTRAISAYRQFVTDQPTHAWAHYKLARLLNSAGAFAEANNHFLLARDYDGVPLRCISLIEEVYRRVAQNHAGCILIDGPTVLRSISRRGILDADLFHDTVHPTLAGHVALAEAVLHGLKSHSAFNWPAAIPAPA